MIVQFSTHFPLILISKLMRYETRVNYINLQICLRTKYVQTSVLPQYKEYFKIMLSVNGICILY